MSVLKGVPRIISPTLLKYLAEMGHGDSIVIADANFPATSVSEAQQRVPRLAHLPCSGADTLTAILRLLPIDTYVQYPAFLMSRVPDDEAKNLEVSIWDTYRGILNKAEGRAISVGFYDRATFYKKAAEAFCVVATAETALYANIIITKGVIPPEPKESAPASSKTSATR